MISLTKVPNIYEPMARRTEPVEFVAGARLGELVPAAWDKTNLLSFVNGDRCDSLDVVLEDGDLITLATSPTDPVHIIGWIVLAVVAASIAQDLMPEIPTLDSEGNPDGSSTYGYFGFQNSFRAEGDPLPIVYGKIRTAPPIINSHVAGNYNQPTPTGTLSHGESLMTMLAISEGPIGGVGRFLGSVETDEDFAELVGVGSPVSGAQLMINSLNAASLQARLIWRTGSAAQEPFGGFDAASFETDATQVYSIELKPTNGTSGITDALKPAGVFAAGSSSVIEDFEDQRAEVLIRSKADSASILLNFEHGLYNTDDGPGGDGSVDFDVVKTVRVQYQETDAAGTGVGDVCLLPAFVIHSGGSGQFAFQAQLDFIPSTVYVPPANQGYFSSQSTSSQVLRTNSVLQYRPSVLTGSQEWTMAAWVAARSPASQGINNAIWGWSNPTGGSVQIQGAANFYELECGSGETAHGIFLTRDETNVLGGGTSQMYVVLHVATSTGGRGVKYISEPLGSYTSPRWADQNWNHITVTYNGSTFVSGATAATVTCWLNGASFVCNMSPDHGVPNLFGDDKGVYTYPAWASVGSSARMRLGGWQDETSGDVRYDTRLKLCQFLFVTRVLTSLEIQALGYPYSEGHNTSDVRAYVGDDQAIGIVPMDEEILGDGGDYYYRNYCGALSTTDEASEFNGDLKLRTHAGHTATGSPIWSLAGGTPKSAYWKVHIFVSEPQLTGNSPDAVTIRHLAAIRSEDYAYPLTAVAAVRIGANGQVNNQTPSITLVVSGMIVGTWDGGSLTNGQPALVPAFSQNPAWIAADLITNSRYGLGAEFTVADIDWPSFFEWANYCDEGVPDAFGELDFFGVAGLDISAASDSERVTFYVGLIDTSDVSQQTLPSTWTGQVVTGEGGSRVTTSSVSVPSVTEGGLDDGWVTANDVIGGLNGASNMLDIFKMTIHTSDDFHGWKTYATVVAGWNRNSGGNEVWPPNFADGSYVFSDSYNLTSLGKLAGFEKRAMFDGVFDEQDVGGWEAVLEVFTAGRAMPVKAGQHIYARVDAPREPMAVFGQGNIGTGSLIMHYLGPDTKPNSCEGDILDSQHNFEKSTVLVDHASLQNSSTAGAVRKERVQLRGVTRRSQATRDCTYRLNRYFLLRRSCEFLVGPDAVNLLPGDRFRLSHDVPQYGYSGRLRLGADGVNFFPDAGADLTVSWDVNEGNCSMSEYALATTTSVARPAGFTASTVLPVDMRGIPMSSGGKLALAAGNSGADGSGLTPWWATQHCAMSPALYPPESVTAVLDEIPSLTYQSSFSAYVKEAALGSAEYVRMNIYRYVTNNGALIDASTAAIWRWSSGALALVSSDTGITASTTSIGSGWYRVGIVYNAATAATPAVGDCLQAKTYAYGGAAATGTFKPVADGGKGTNFLQYGDPMDASKTTAWTHYNGSTSANSIANSTQYTPFYDSTTGTHGHVVRMKKDTALAAGTTPPCLVQTHTLTTGTAVSSWNGERVCFTGFVRLAATNTSVDTSFYVDIRAAATVDSNNLLNGEGIRAEFTSSPSWAAGTKTEIEAAGTVANFVSSIAPVVQNSTTNDANWQQVHISFDYTPSSGSLTALSLGVWTDGTIAGDQVVEFWGFRMHGASSGGSLVNPWYHRGAVLWGHQYERASSSVSTLASGVNVRLDRDVTLTAGKTYELLARSSFQPDPSFPRDNQAVLTVDSTQVPTSGSTTIAANANLLVSQPSGFTLMEGDLYSFGETNKSFADFTVDSITLDPEKMERKISATEYNEDVFNDTAFGVLGRTTVSDLPDPSVEDEAMAEFGVGWGGSSGSRIGGVTVQASSLAQITADGGTIAEVSVSWVWPAGVPMPSSFQFFLRPVGTTQMRYVGQAATANGSQYTFTDERLEDGKRYTIFVRPIGHRGTLGPIDASFSVEFVAALAPTGSRLPAPVVTASVKGTKEVYKVAKTTGSFSYNAVEGRIGGWILGSPAYQLSPDQAYAETSRTLVGQASTPTGDTGMRLFSRVRTASGYYGRLAELLGEDQIPDVGYTKSVATEDNYATNGTKSSELAISSNVLTWDASSSALTGTYTPTQITLSSAQRVFANCQVAGVQIRPETLGDCTFALGDAVGARWSLEGPMDDLAGDNTTVKIQWKYGSSSLSSTFTDFEPGEVYAKVMLFKITFTRPKSTYDMRITRVLSQALTLPAFEAGDIDGGTF